MLATLKDLVEIKALEATMLIVIGAVIYIIVKYRGEVIWK